MPKVLPTLAIIAREQTGSWPIILFTVFSLDNDEANHASKVSGFSNLVELAKL